MLILTTARAASGKTYVPRNMYVPGVNHVDIEGLSKAACINVLQIVKHGVVNLEREERHLAAFICFFLKLVF